MPIFAFHHIVIFSKGNLEFYCYKRETKLIYEKITLSANFEISISFLIKKIEIKLFKF